MALSFKNKNYTLTDLDQALFTVPAGIQVIAIGLRAANKTDVTAFVNVKRYSADAAAEFSLCGKDTIIGVKSSLNLADGNRIVLTEGDQLIANANAIDTIDLTLEYLELPVQEVTP